MEVKGHFCKIFATICCICKYSKVHLRLIFLRFIHGTYRYLNKNGYLYYIKYKGRLCGDVSLQYNGDVAIVIEKNYQNKHIGRRVLKEIITLAKKLNYEKIQANIYDFNLQSKKVFELVGFNKIKEETYIYIVN